MKEDFKRIDFKARSHIYMNDLRLTAAWLAKDHKVADDLIHKTIDRTYRLWHPCISNSNLKILLFRMLTASFFDGFQNVTRTTSVHRLRKMSTAALQNRFGSAEYNNDGSARKIIVRLPVEIRYVRILSRLGGFSNLEIAKIIGLNPEGEKLKSFKGSRLLPSELFTYGEG